MSRRSSIITLSVVACVFGALSLWGTADLRGSFYALNVVCSIAASILASLDLRRRGYGWGWVMLLYVVFSSQRDYEERAVLATQAG